MATVISEGSGIMPIRLDGDNLRVVLDATEAWSALERRKLGVTYARLAKMLASQGHIVIVSVVAMYEEVFNELKEFDPEVLLFILESTQEQRLVRDVAKGVYLGRDASVESFSFEVPEEAIRVSNNNSLEFADALKFLKARVIEKLAAKKSGIQNPQSRALFNESHIPKYWNQYYKNESAQDQPSSFAIDVAANPLFDSANALIDFGCGDARDSFYLSRKFKVVGVDISETAIKQNAMKADNSNTEISFTCIKNQADLTISLRNFKPDIFYARFVFHALTFDQEDEILSALSKEMPSKGYLAIECRTVNDPLMLKGVHLSETERIYGHYRRFIDPLLFVAKLQAYGFEILTKNESTGYSKTRDDDPSLLRIIAQKS